MNSITKAFFFGLTDELEKAGMCGAPHKKTKSKGKGKGLALGKGKGPMGIPKKAATAIPKDMPGAKGVRKQVAKVLKHRRSATARKLMKDPEGKMAKGYRSVLQKMYKKAMDDGAGAAMPHSPIKAKIEAARRDPSTKANPKDTGPKGSGTADPRFKAMKGKGFGKAATEIFFAGFDEGMGKEAKRLFLRQRVQKAGRVAAHLGKKVGKKIAPEGMDTIREAAKDVGRKHAGPIAGAIGGGLGGLTHGLKPSAKGRRLREAAKHSAQGAAGGALGMHLADKLTGPAGAKAGKKAGEALSQFMENRRRKKA